MIVDLQAQDTIAAVATAAGSAAIAIIRVSGPDAKKIRERVFVPRHQGRWVSAKLRLGWLRPAGDFDSGSDSDLSSTAPDTFLDEVMLVWFGQGKSYTSEPSLEIHVHGGVLNTRRCLSAVLDAGARMAEPGEFTQRAFLSGRMDLSQAEAVQDIISASSEDALILAQRNLSGAAATTLEPLRQDLLSLLAEVEAGLDFPEESFPQHLMHNLAQRVQKIKQQILLLLDAAKVASRLREQPRVVLLGAPNAGKSSLLNALTLSQRAITNARPGTTRDTLEAPLVVGRAEMTLIDTAGLRDSVDEIENEAQRRALDSIRQADLAIVVVDGSCAPSDDTEQAIEVAGAALLFAINKSDLQSDPGLLAWAQNLEQEQVFVSARSGAGLDMLRQKVSELTRPVQAQLSSGWLTQQKRHVDELHHCAAALSEVEHVLAAGLPEEIIALELQRALQALSHILGRDLGDEVLHNIFARFCVGK